MQKVNLNLTVRNVFVCLVSNLAALGVEVIGHRQKQLTQTLIVRLLKTHLFLLLRKLGEPRLPPVF